MIGNFIQNTDYTSESSSYKIYKGYFSETTMTRSQLNSIIISEIECMDAIYWEEYNDTIYNSMVILERVTATSCNIWCIDKFDILEKINSHNFYFFIENLEQSQSSNYPRHAILVNPTNKNLILPMPIHTSQNPEDPSCLIFDSNL